MRSQAVGHLRAEAALTTLDQPAQLPGNGGVPVGHDVLEPRPAWR
jgi:hypothetical protein